MNLEEFNEENQTLIELEKEINEKETEVTELKRIFKTKWDNLRASSRKHDIAWINGKFQIKPSPIIP